jgi:hypothetical protein
MNEELLAASALFGALLVSHNFFAFAQWIRFKQRTTRYLFFCSVSHLIQSGSVGFLSGIFSPNRDDF